MATLGEKRIGTARAWEGHVKFKIVSVVLVTVTVIFVTVTLLCGAASPAAAQPLRHPGKHVPQVSGARLQAALLQPSAFGTGFQFSASLNTGSRLQSAHATKHVPSLSCDNFETEVYVGFLGDTAGAELEYTNPNARAGYPDAVIGGYEDVVQFATTVSATTLFHQDRTKYSACQSFTYLSSNVTWQGAAVSVSGTKIDGYPAFVVVDTITATGYLPVYISYLYVVADTNVYSLCAFSGHGQEPFPALMTELIQRVQALYPHHRK